MTPGEFDPATAREVIGDASARLIEAKARADADADTFNPPALDRESWIGQWDKSMRVSIYLAQFNKRKERNARKAEAAIFAKTPAQKAALKELRGA